MFSHDEFIEALQKIANSKKDCGCPSLDWGASHSADCAKEIARKTLSKYGNEYESRG